MNFLYRYRQFKNLLFRKTHSEKPLRWVFIYGLPRSGTTYTYHQFLQVSRAGVSDWEVRGFALACHAVENSRQTWIDLDKLFYDLRDNILGNAAVGSGDHFEVIVKQAGGNQTDLEFWKRLLKSEPELKFFLFREPAGWWSSTVEKFGYTEDEGVELYQSALESYSQIGGVPIEYGEQIPAYLRQLSCFNAASLTPFKPSRKTFLAVPLTLNKCFDDFKKNVIRDQN